MWQTLDTQHQPLEFHLVLEDANERVQELYASGVESGWVCVPLMHRLFVVTESGRAISAAVVKDHVKINRPDAQIPARTVPPIEPPIEPTLDQGPYVGLRPEPSND